MTNEINTLTIIFSNKIYQDEVPFFRGAVLTKVPKDLDVFHNHQENGLRYRYPLIQYKRIGSKAAIVCIGEGTKAIGHFFSSSDMHFNVGNREDSFEVESVKADRAIVQTWNDEFRYTIRKWIAFNQKNYKQYQQIDGVVQQVEFLQRLLVGNILSMCSGLDIRIEKEIKCEITNILSQKITRYKEVPMTCLDVEFKSNVFLPDYIGLGKGTSRGFGMIKVMRK